MQQGVPLREWFLLIIIADMLSCPTLVLDLILLAVRMTSEGGVGTMKNEFG